MQYRRIVVRAGVPIATVAHLRAVVLEVAHDREKSRQARGVEVCTVNADRRRGKQRKATEEVNRFDSP